MDERRFAPVVTAEPRSCDYHVMVKPIGGICNLACAYCYYLPTVDMYRAQPGHTGDFRMSLQTYETFATQYLDRPIDTISFAWQGGEPTLMGLEWFQNALEIQRKHTRPGQVVENSLQTNGTLLDDAWCEFFRDNNFLIGLSVDGPAAYHDKNRRTAGGEPSHDKVLQAIKRLRAYNVEFNSLVVLSQANVNDPDGVYRFLINAGLRHVQLIPLLEYNRQSLAPIPLAITGRQYGQFLCRVFDLWFEHNIGSIFVQIIEQTLAAHLGVSPTLCIHMPTCGRALILEHNGDVYACDHYPFPSDLRGNILEQPLHEMVNSPEQIAFGKAKRNNLTRQCRDCVYLAACNGGCCKHRIVSLDGEANRHNWFCEGYKMFFDHSFEKMAAIAMALRRGLPARSVRDQCTVSARTRQAESPLPSPMAPPDAALRPHTSRPDRNSPCPCGSGLKYKKCCGRKG